MDITEFVRNHRLAYQNNYMMNTLRATEGETLVIDASHPADSAQKKFDDHKVIVTFKMPPHTDVWAMNVIQQQDGKCHGCISVCRDLLRKDTEFRKFVLAEEWLEVMIAFDDPARRQRERKVTGRTYLVELFSQMGRPTLWSDDDEDLQQLHIGLQHLLVPEVTIDVIGRIKSSHWRAELGSRG